MRRAQGQALHEEQPMPCLLLPLGDRTVAKWGSRTVGTDGRNRCPRTVRWTPSGTSSEFRVPLELNRWVEELVASGEPVLSYPKSMTYWDRAFVHQMVECLQKISGQDVRSQSAGDKWDAKVLSFFNYSGKSKEVDHEDRDHRILLKGNGESFLPRGEN